MFGAGDVRVEDRPEPVLKAPTDAIVRVDAYPDRTFAGRGC